jgi:hypothetical protein
MASQKAINDSIRLLTANGLQGAPSTPERIALVAQTWAAVLADLDDATLQAAVLTHLRDPDACQFWPQPGKLLAATPQRRQLAAVDPETLWGQCLELASRYGSYNIGAAMANLPEPQDVTAAALHAIGGLRVLCVTHYEEHAALRASFRAAVKASVSRQVAATDHQLTDSQAGSFLRLVKDGAK